MNELNILPADFGKNPGDLFLDDPEIWIKILNDTNWTEFKPLGYAQVEKSFSIEKEYAEFRTGIPETLVDKALVSVKRFFSCNIAQLQPETIALITDGIIETGSTETRVFYGTDTPASIALAIILKGKKRDGKALELRIRKALMSSESVELALGSKEFGGMEFKVEVVEDENPLESNPTWKILGEVNDSATNLITSPILTLSAANADIKAGMTAYGDGIPEGAKVLTNVTTSVTLDKDIPLAKTTARAVRFINDADIAKANVAYWVIGK